MQFDNITETMKADYERLALSHSSTKPRFSFILSKIWSDYLSKNIEIYQTKGISVLELNCGYGLFLKDIGEFLTVTDTTLTPRLVGLDKDEKAIKNAKAFANLPITGSQKRLPLEFLLTPKLDDFTPKLGNFDLVVAINQLNLTSNLEELVRYGYAHLNPGGVVYLRTFVTRKVPPENLKLANEMDRLGWIPFLGTTRGTAGWFVEQFTNFCRDINGGLDVGLFFADWLRSLGAVDIEEYPEIVYGQNLDNIRTAQAIREWSMLVKFVGPVLVKTGYLEQLDFEQIMNNLYEKVDPSATTYISYIDVIGRKPDA